MCTRDFVARVAMFLFLFNGYGPVARQGGGGSCGWFEDVGLGFGRV